LYVFSKTAAVSSYQSYGDMMRFNPHYHCIVLEGGIDETGSFYTYPDKRYLKAHRGFQEASDKTFCWQGSCSAAILRPQFCGAQFYVEGPFL